MLLRGGPPPGAGQVPRAAGCCRGRHWPYGTLAAGCCRAAGWFPGGSGHSQAGGTSLQGTTARAAQLPGGGFTPAQLELDCAVVECGGSSEGSGYVFVLQTVGQHTLEVMSQISGFSYLYYVKRLLWLV
jgi:hypothetical protein